jgi:transposase-like protein
MPRTRKTHAAQLKAQVALEAIKGHRTSSEIAQLYGVHPNLVATWKRHALELLPELFRPQDVDGVSRAEDDAEKQELYRQIGQMKVELDFLKKKVSLLQ